MTQDINLFTRDHLTLTRWELVKLFFGRTLKQGALVIRAVWRL